MRSEEATLEFVAKVKEKNAFDVCELDIAKALNMEVSVTRSYLQSAVKRNLLEKHGNHYTQKGE